MEQVRAARCILVDARPPDPYEGKTDRQKEDELAAFMAIFHPDREYKP
jgi:3-mercaptopyruvate sulfurtransferase SseA